MSEKELECPSFALIPFRVQTDDVVPDAAKIFFGQITGLCVRYGYCWATDEQLSKMKNCSLRNIQRWLEILETAGYIVRQTHNEMMQTDDGKCKWIKKRRIHINNAFASEIPLEKVKEREISKNVCGIAKNGESIEPAKNGESIEPAKNGESNNKQEDKERYNTGAPSAVIVPSLLNLNIDNNLRIKISKEWSPEEIDLAVDRCLKWDGRSNDQQGIFTTLKKASTWNDTKTKEEIEKENLKFLISLQKLDNSHIGNTRVIIGNKYIEFVAGMKCDVFHIENKNFKKEVAEFMEYLHNLTKK